MGEFGREFQRFRQSLRALEATHNEDVQKATATLRKENIQLRVQVQELRKALKLAGSKVEDDTAQANPAKGSPDTEPAAALKEPRDVEAQAGAASGKEPTSRQADIEAYGEELSPDQIRKAKQLAKQRTATRMLAEKQKESVATVSGTMKVLREHHFWNPNSWLISPRSHLMKFWDVATAIALMFSGVVTPYESVFLGVTEDNWTLFVINRIVDVMFLIDFALQFFLKVEVQRPHNGGVMMLQNPAQLRWRYLKSWFIIDLISTVPYDLISLQISSASSVFRRAKILRLFKLLRMVKLLRMTRTSRILERWRDDVNIQFATQRLMSFLVILFLLSHWMACIWGLVGLTLGKELCNDGVRLPDDAEVPLDEVSWTTTLYAGGKTSPDTPCNHFEVYVASLHWAVMTITSIGYGDIVPVRFEEYLIGTGCMFFGGVLWAYAIGSVCSIISNRSPLEVCFEQNRDLLNRAMKEAQLPQQEQHVYREFLREAKSYDRRIGFVAVAEKLSPGLRRKLLFHVTRGSIEQVYYFKHAPKEFLMGVAVALEPHFFSRGEAMGGLAHSLCMMDRGTVLHKGMMLVQPSVFHEDFIITKKQLQRVCRTYALSCVQVLVLTREQMEDLLEGFPTFSRIVRKYAVRIAFCRALHLTARHYHCYLKGQGDENDEDSVGVSLSLAFSATFKTDSYKMGRQTTQHLAQSSSPRAEEEKDAVHACTVFV